MTKITVKVDGVTYVDDVEPRLLLVHYLRENLGKTGTPVGCDTSNCGACTVHLNGMSVKSCSVLAVQADGGEITTIEGLANGEWHPATSGYVAAPGDVAVYGLSLGVHPSAVHVAIVTSDRSGRRGPDVVNGDGDRTGFSVVETGTDQVRADAGPGDSTLVGYVSPP